MTQSVAVWIQTNDWHDNSPNKRAIWPEDDLANFLSLHLTTPKAVGMAEAEFTNREAEKASIYHIFHQEIDGIFTAASSGMGSESEGAHLQGIDNISHRFSA